MIINYAVIYVSVITVFDKYDYGRNHSVEIYSDYSRFKEACSNFKELFTDKRLTAGSLYCHPLIEGLLYVPCTPEEAKSNGIDICRMSDMLLMSADGESFVPFKFQEAQKIAEENGSVFISDITYSGAFEAKLWMVDRKHDTIIVSEEHMKKEGIPYAPVFPLTNVVQHFRKVNCSFLYTKGTLEDPAVLSEEDISKKLDAFLDTQLAGFQRIEIVNSTEFELYDGTVSMDRNESRCIALDKGLALIDKIKAAIEPNEKDINAAGYKFSTNDFELKGFAKAAEKCGVTYDPKLFDGKASLEEKKDAFRKYVSEKNGYGFKYTEPDKDKFDESLREIELSQAEPEELKKKVGALLTVRPANRAVFNLARAICPAEAEHIENIAEFWGAEGLSSEELGKYLDSAYVPAECRGKDGKLICGEAKLKLISEDINAAALKYKLKNAPVLKELADFAEEAEKASRTYNGTVFDSVEAMEKAVKNEKELIDKCSDLSALNEEELKKLYKYIYELPLDRKTTGKFLLKIKIALGECQLNQLKLLTTGITLRTPEELTALKKKLSSDEFDEVLAKPFIEKVDDVILSASLKELSDMFKEIPDAAKADSLETALNSGKYDKMFIRHFTAKLNEARDVFAKKELEAVCKGIESAEKAALDEIEKKLAAIKCRESLKNPYKKAIADRFNSIEAAEAEKVFAGIESADKAKIAELREIIKSVRFRKTLTDKYIPMLDARMVEIENSEFTKKCDKIPAMTKEQLDEVTAELKSGKYPESITDKYLPKVAERETALLKAELANMCKDIAAMDLGKLDNLEARLKDKKYPEELTSGYFDTVNARRKTIRREEADKLCKDIASMDKKALAELSEKLKDEKFDPDYVKKYFTQIDERFNKIETDKLTEMCKGIEKLKKPELEKLSADITAAGFKKENAEPFLEKIRKAEIELMKSELENLCKNIANTPRNELSKLKEALSGDDFDKELSKKYIEQIDKRTEELIKKELEDICKNLANAPKEKLESMKQQITAAPEYAEPGKAYLEEIDTRLRQINKAEFDKQMESIDKLNRDDLEKFIEELENRKPALDAKLYEASKAKCKERGETLEKEELDKLCEGLEKADLAKLGELKEKITEGDFTPAVTFPYIKKIDAAVTDLHVKHFSKLMEKIDTMSRAELVVLLERINANDTNCPEDLLTKYIGKVNSKIREADRKMLDKKCAGLGGFGEHASFELIKDINEMDIDENDKKHYVNTVELHITDVKVRQRDVYVQKLDKFMGANSITGAHFYVPGISKSFESLYTKIQQNYASTEQFEFPVLIHEPVMGHPETSFLLTVDYLYYNGKNGFGRIPVTQIERFEGKGGIFGTSFKSVEKGGKTTELPCGFDKKSVENAAKTINSILQEIQKDKSAAKLREAEEIKAVEEAKLREKEQLNAELAAARKHAEEAEKNPEPVIEEKKPEEKKPDVKPEEKKPEEKVGDKKPEEKSEDKKPEAKRSEIKVDITPIEPIKHIKPIQVVVSDIPEVKNIPPMPDLPKTPDISKPAAASAVPAKPAPAAPAKPAVPAKPAAPAPVAPAKPAAKTAEPPTPVVKKMKFCDQCGAKIENENAKFCVECGNKLIK